MNSKKILLLAFFVSIQLFFIYPINNTIIDKNGNVINRELIPHINNKNKKVEFFWIKPIDNNGKKLSVIIYIHGHQENDKTGGEVNAKLGMLGRRANYQGLVAVSVSQPGYGNSDGPPDYCGPYTQEAVITVIEYFRKQSFVNPEKILLYGVSRGAIVASMVATKDSRLAGVISQAGAYDIKEMFETTLEGIKSNIQNEAGIKDKNFLDRSAINHVQNIKSPFLIIHGENDDRHPVNQAKSFSKKLSENNIKNNLIIIPNTGHSIKFSLIETNIDTFINEILK